MCGSLSALGKSVAQDFTSIGGEGQTLLATVAAVRAAARSGGDRGAGLLAGNGVYIINKLYM